MFTREKDRDFPSGPVFKTSPFHAGDVGSIPGRGADIPHASWPKNQSIKQKQYYNKFSKDFKSGPHQTNLKKKNKTREKNKGRFCHCCIQSNGQENTCIIIYINAL